MKRHHARYSLIPILDTYAYAGQVGDIKRFAVLFRSERASHALDTFDHFD
jgi:hypothetical protein